MDEVLRREVVQSGGDLQGRLQQLGWRHDALRRRAAAVRRPGLAEEASVGAVRPATTERDEVRWEREGKRWWREGGRGGKR